MDHLYLRRLETEINDPKQDQYLVARSVGRDLYMKLSYHPITLSDDAYADLGADFISLLQKHNIMATPVR